MDVQYLLFYGSPEEILQALHANVSAFASCGGYIAANSHHGVKTIRGGNLLTMASSARDCLLPFA